MSCSICYDGNKIIKTKCSHYFCRDCLKQWSFHSRSCPLCRRELFWDLTEEIINFLEKNKSKNIPREVIITKFMFYYRGIISYEIFSSVGFILDYIDYKDTTEYNFKNIIDAIESNYPPRFIFYIFLREMVRYQNKSLYKILKNLLNSFFQ